MEIIEAVRKVIQEMVIPELGDLKERLTVANQRLDGTNKRLDDMNTHIVDQSRRIDHLREELRNEIAGTNERIDRLYEVIVRRDEHYTLEAKVMKLEEEVSAIKAKIGV
jgi:uncharacterized coiled-coil DUF342 family protein